MTPKDLLDAGRLDEAVHELTQQVKAKPTDTPLRVFLFELICFQGDFDRAVKQLDVIANQGDGMDSQLAVQVYRDLLAAETTRRQVFHDAALPKFLLSPPPYADQYVMLVKKMSQSAPDALSILAEAEELSPAVTGRVGDRTFSKFRDADDRVASMLEVFHGSDYLWVPLEQIRSLQVTAPKSLRDLVWPHARIETYEGSVGDVFVPALYVDTGLHRNDQVRLGRMTEWQSVEDQMVCGSGQRVFLVDDDEVSLLELRDVQFDARGSTAASQT